MLNLCLMNTKCIVSYAFAGVLLKESNKKRPEKFFQIVLAYIDRAIAS